MKAQASLEQLVVIATGLAMVSVAFYIAASYSSDSAKLSLAKDAVERLAGSADHVYALGPNSKEYITVYLPDGFSSSDVGGRRILVAMPNGGGSTDVFANTKANLVGNLPKSGGKYKILVEYLLSGKVRIGEAGLACSPTVLTRIFSAGGSGTDSITITNIAGYNVTGINATHSGSSLVSIGTPSPASLADGENGSLSVSYGIPVDQASGTYGATVTVESDNGGSCTTQITLNINGVDTCASLCSAQGYTAGTCRAAAQDCGAAGEDYRPENDAVCSGGSPRCCCWPSADIQGPLVTFVNSTPNATTATNVSIYAVCDDTNRGNNFIAAAQVQVDFGAWNSANPSSGSFATTVVQGVYINAGYLVGGQHIAAVKCADVANNTGPTVYYYFNVSAPDMLGPIITYMNHTNPSNLAFADIIESGSATDQYTGGSNVANCKIKADSGPWQDAAPADGAFNSVTEGFSYNLGKLSAGSHTVYAYCTDALGNVGGTFTDVFGVSPADVVLAIEHSNSMAAATLDAYDSSIVSTASTNFTLLKNISVSQTGNPLNVTAEIKSGTAGCIAYFEARVGASVVASGSTASTSYANVIQAADFSGFSAPYSVGIYMKRSSGASCTVYNRNFRVSDLTVRMDAAKTAAKAFLDIVSNTTQAGLVSYATSASTEKQLAMMNSAANINELKEEIDDIEPQGGNICLACAIDNGVAELGSARGRYPNATKTIILMTDGPGNVGDTYAACTSARNSHVIVYAIGFGSSADPVELTNIALLTGGEYYYAPDSTTLRYIYQHIGE